MHTGTEINNLGYVMWWLLVFAAAITPGAFGIAQRGAGRLGEGWWYGRPLPRWHVLVLTAATAVTVALLTSRVDGAPAKVAYAGFGVAGVVMAVCDWQTLRLPNVIMFPAYVWMAAWLFAASAWQKNWQCLWLGVAAGVVLFLLGCAIAFARPGEFGWGDCKLLGLIGLALGYLGWPQAMWGPIAGFAVSAIMAILFRRQGEGANVPAGTGLLIGAIVVIILLRT